MTAKAKAWTSLGIAMGIVIGGLLGTLIPTVMITLGFIGDAFIGGLTILSFVMVTTTLITSVSGLGAISKFRHAIYKNLGFWGITLIFAIALAIGVGQFVLTEVSDGSSAINSLHNAPGANSGKAVFWLGSILLALGMGLTAIKLKIKARSLMTWFKNFDEGITSLVGLLTYILPVGVMFAVGNFVARDGYYLTNMGLLAGNFVLATVIGLAVLGLVVMPLILIVISGVNPIQLYGKLLPAILAAFGTMSSRLALPFVMSALESDRQVDKRAAGLAVSFGTIFNVAPTVLIVMVSTIFMANVTGTPLSIMQFIMIGLISAGLSIGVGSGVGMIVPVIVGAVSLTGDFQALSPAMVIVVSVTWLLEPIRAAFNSLGDGVSAAVLSQVFEFKTALRSPTRTAPKRFGYDRSSDQSARRGRRPDHSSGRPGQSDSSSERPTRGRSQGSRDGDRRQSSDKDRSRGRDRKETRDTKSNSRTSSRDSSSRDQKRSSAVTRGSGTKDFKEAATNSPFSMNSGGDPALDMNPPVASVPVVDEQKSGRPRSPRKERPTKKTERKTISPDSNRSSTESRSPKGTTKTDSGVKPSSERRKTSRTTDRKSDKPDHHSISEKTTETSQTRNRSLTKSKIESELVRVSEQLKRMDDRLEPIASKTKPEAIEADDLVANTVETKPIETKPVETKLVETESPFIDKQPSEVEPVTTPAENSPVIEVESQPEKLEPVEKVAGISDEEKKLAASFGRSKERNQALDNQTSTPLAGEEDKSEEKIDKAVEAAPVDLAADITEKSKKETEFGRSKRKKRLR